MNSQEIQSIILVTLPPTPYFRNGNERMFTRTRFEAEGKQDTFFDIGKNLPTEIIQPSK